MSTLHVVAEQGPPTADPDGGDPDAGWDVFDLPALARQVKAVLGIPARAKGLTLDIHLSSSVPERVIGDHQCLLEALAALIENSIHATDRGEVVASISADSTVKGRTVLCVEVSDTGAGADRLDAGNAGRLALSRRLVELMDGRLEHSSASGMGSTCRFTLPVGLPGRPLAVA